MQKRQLTHFGTISPSPQTYKIMETRWGVEVQEQDPQGSTLDPAFSSIILAGDSDKWSKSQGNRKKKYNEKGRKEGKKKF